MVSPIQFAEKLVGSDSLRDQVSTRSDSDRVIEQLERRIPDPPGTDLIIDL